MKKILVVGSNVPEGLLECLRGNGMQANLFRLPEQQDLKETIRSFDPHAAIFLQPTDEAETCLQKRLIDDHTARIPTLVLGPALWQRYSQAEHLDIHLGAISTPQGIVEWIEFACAGTA